MKKLTDRQREIYDFLRNFHHAHGFPPTLREIGDNFGFSVKAALDVLEVLAKKGWISRNFGKPRTITLLKEYFSVKVRASCQNGNFQAGDVLIVNGVLRPVAGDGVVVENGDTLRIEAFCGQKSILGKIVGLCREM